MIKKVTTFSCVFLGSISLHANQALTDGLPPTSSESAAITTEVKKEPQAAKEKNHSPHGNQIQHPNIAFIIQSFIEWPPYVTIIKDAGTAASLVLKEHNRYHHVEKTKESVVGLIRDKKMFSGVPEHVREDVIKEIVAVQVPNELQTQSSSLQPAATSAEVSNDQQSNKAYRPQKSSAAEQHAIENILLEAYKRSFFNEERQGFLSMLHTFRILLRPIIHEVVERDPQTNAHNSLLLEFLDSDGSHAKTFFYQKITNLNLLQQAGHEFTALCSDLWSSLTHQVKVAYKKWYQEEAKKEQEAKEGISASNA